MLTFRTRLLSSALVAAGVLAGMGQAAHAQTNLAPGQTGVLAPTAGPFGGTLIGSQSIAFTSTNVGNTIQGFLNSAVFSGGTNATGLDFYYQIVVTSPPSNTTLDQFSIAGFNSAFTSNVAVAQTTTAPTADFTAGGLPTSADDRSGGAGTTIFFNFNNTGATPFTSGPGTIQVVRTTGTSASQVGQVGAGISGGGVALSSQAFGLVTPSVNGPEPGTFVLLGTGLVSMGGMVARRRRIAKK